MSVTMNYPTAILDYVNHLINNPRKELKTIVLKKWRYKKALTSYSKILQGISRIGFKEEHRFDGHHRYVETLEICNNYIEQYEKLYPEFLIEIKALKEAYRNKMIIIQNLKND